MLATEQVLPGRCPTNKPASALPSVYLALAFLSTGVFWLRLRLGRRRSDRRELGRWLVGSGLVTLGFWWAVGSPGDLTLYGLYLWSGLFATLIVVRFWTLADDLFTVSQAKRVFAFIGAGAGVGAIAGTALARALTGVLPARDVLLAAAVVFVLTGAGPVLLMPRPEEPTPDGEPAAPDGPRQTLRRPNLWLRPLKNDGREVAGGKDFCVGHRRRLETTDLVVFVTARATSPLRLVLTRR